MLSRRSLLAGMAAVALPASAAAKASIADLRGSLDATHEGLHPGAPDDQSAAMRRALARAETSGRPLFLPPGRYEVADIDLPERAHLVGIPGESRVVLRGGRWLLRARHAKRLRLQGVTLDGNNRPLDEAISGLLFAEGADDVAVEDCSVLASAGNGLALEGCAGRIAGCRIAGISGAGLQLGQSRGLSVTGNVVERCGDRGILIYRWEEGRDDTVLRGNRISDIAARSGGTGQYGNGIQLSKADGVIVTDNRVDNCDFSAIRAFSSSNIQVSGNVATRSGETAVYVEFAYQGAVVANNLVDEACIGISLANFVDHGGRLGVCSGNVVRNLQPRTRLPRGYDELVGIGIAAEADMAVTGNVVEGAPRWGLLLGWGESLRDVAATGNVVRDSGIGIAVSVVEGAGAALIADNLVSRSERGAIVGMRWAEAATGDLALGGADAWPHLTVARNRVS